MDLAAPLSPGTLIGGRFAVVAAPLPGALVPELAADDAQTGGRVRVRVFPAAGRDPERRRRLLQELAAAARVAHPHVAVPLAWGTDQALQVDYAAFEHAQGDTLAALLAQRGVPPFALGARILSEAAQGLAGVHRAGMVHGAVAPGAIFLARDEGERRLCVRLTGLGTRLGVDAPLAPPAPEVARAGGECTTAGDVYALGVTAYALLAGLPDEVRAALAARSRGEGARIPSPSEVRPAVPAALGEVILCALEADPSRRFPDAATLAAALERIHPAEPAPVPATSPAPPTAPVPATASLPAPPAPAAAPPASPAGPRPRAKASALAESDLGDALYIPPTISSPRPPAAAAPTPAPSSAPAPASASSSASEPAKTPAKAPPQAPAPRATAGPAPAPPARAPEPSAAEAPHPQPSARPAAEAPAGAARPAPASPSVAAPVPVPARKVRIAPASTRAGAPRGMVVGAVAVVALLGAGIAWKTGLILNGPTAASASLTPEGAAAAEAAAPAQQVEPEAGAFASAPAPTDALAPAAQRDPRRTPLTPPADPALARETVREPATEPREEAVPAEAAATTPAPRLLGTPVGAAPPAARRPEPRVAARTLAEPPAAALAAPPPAANRVYTASEVDRAPVLRNAAEMRRALERNVPSSVPAGDTATARVRFVVGTDGRVDLSSLQLLSATHPNLARSAERVLARARFEPARTGGEPVRTHVDMPFVWVVPRG